MCGVRRLTFTQGVGELAQRPGYMYMYDLGKRSRPKKDRRSHFEKVVSPLRQSVGRTAVDGPIMQRAQQRPASPARRRSPASPRVASPGKKPSSPSPVTSPSSGLKKAPLSAAKDPNKPKRKMKAGKVPPRITADQLASDRPTGEQIPGGAPSDDEDADEQRPADAEALLAEVMAFTPRARAAAAQPSPRSTGRPVPVECPSPQFERDSPSPAIATRGSLVPLETPPSPSANGLQQSPSWAGSPLSHGGSPPERSPTGAVSGRELEPRSYSMYSGYSPPPKAKVREPADAAACQAAGAAALGIDLGRVAFAAEPVACEAAAAAAAAQSDMMQMLTPRGGAPGTPRALAHSLLCKAQESCSAEDVAPLPDLVRRGVLSIIESADQSTWALKHVEELNDRSQPRVETGIHLKKSPAPQLFAQISGGAVSQLPLRHVEQVNDRSAPLLEAHLSIKRDARPSLFAELRRKFGMGPTGVGAKRKDVD